MSWFSTRVRAVAATAVLACAGLVVADVPSSFPATYAGKQRIVVTFTYYRGAMSITQTRGLTDEASIVFDDAAALHFEPAYPGGTAAATYTQTDDSKVQFAYDAPTLDLLHDYYLGKFIEKGVLRSTDEFEISFRDGKFVFRDGVAKLRGRQPLRFKAKRNGHLILRGYGTLTWRGALQS
jgi:hypothetical protein